MKTNELKIGNYIIYNNDEIGVLSGVQDFLINNGKVAINQRIDIFYNIETIKPIELNKEWFNKLGMTYYSLPTKSNRSVGYYTLKYGNRFKINSSDGNYSFINFRKEVKYVHELQNLYFAITGEELTYENETK
jgi:hypothetical protein